MSKEIVKEVLRNAFKHAAQTLTFIEIQMIMTEELMKLTQQEMNKNKIYPEFDTNNHTCDARRCMGENK